MAVEQIQRIEPCPIAEVLHGILYGMANSAKKGDVENYRSANRTFERWRTIYCNRNHIDEHITNQWDRVRDKICTYLTRTINDMPVRPNLLREAYEIADYSLAR